YGIGGLGEGEDVNDGFNYITMRDGVQLSAMVRLPDPALWGDGPYPTVVEYSGYSPSRPDDPEPGSRIATLLGYASVGVNMRGSGCSGGVFDVFNPAQHADGYDVIEVVARQPWVLNHKVGMVGLSYSGITQLYVARTNPPSLAAVTPLSVIADSWQQLWPGGIYNDGFTRQWLEERDNEAAPNGQSWTDRRIAGGDTTCEAHQLLRKQNFAFEELFRELEFYPDDAAERSLPTLVHEIAVPVYLTGAFQDEQTGGQFAEMLDAFTATPTHKFTLYNGRHVDGYSPLVLTRWWEFLEIYVAQRVPRLSDLVRVVAGPELGKTYDSDDLGFEPDRFTDFADEDYAGVRAAYEAQKPVRVLFESGAGNGQPGAPVARFEASWDAWPPPDAEERVFYLGPDGTLTDDAPIAADGGIDTYEHDADAGAVGFFGPRGYELMKRLWDIRWTQFPEGKSLSYVSAPLAEDMVLAGPVYADLWMTSEVEDVDVQVAIMDVRPDGTEYLLQNGWHRLGHRGLDDLRTNALRVEYTFDESDYEALVPGQFLETKVPMPSVGHPIRKGSRLRVVISTPGRNHGTWEFDNPSYDGMTPVQEVARTPAMPSRIHLSVVTGLTVPDGIAPCPSLRGQPCRDYEPTTNTTLEE
ncbi:MAG: CocE/NonD family hydrolase, partial [Myxococcales bacterium]|nr:CocE/NonD family hydrolase [Myxococcales bacterium]